MIQKPQDFALSLRKHNARRFAGQVFAFILIYSKQSAFALRKSKSLKTKAINQENPENHFHLGIKKVQACKPGSVLSCESSYHLSGRRVAAPL